MKRLDRRRFMMLSSLGAAGTVLAACGNDPDETNLNPTMIPDVAGAPPTLAPVASPASGAAAQAPAEEGGAEGAAGAVTLEAHDPAAWSTNELDVAPGQTISITNTGALPHDFTIDELSIHEALDPGATVDVVFPDDVKVGDTYTYYCSIPGHRELGMEGTITVVEAGAAAPAEGEGESPAAGAAEGGSGPVKLEASDPAAWSTNELEAAPGQVISITNTGALPHDFTIDELSISEALDPGATVEVTVPEDVAAGDEYTYYCSIPGHRELGMEGTLTIVEAGAAAPAAAEGEGEAASSPAAAESSPAASAEASPAAASGAAVELEAIDPFNWSVSEINVKPGDVIHVVNKGVLPHDFTVDELGIAEMLDSGAEVNVSIPDNAEPGEYEFYCSQPGHREGGMEGTLTIS
jgi:plastocyanin